MKSQDTKIIFPHKLILIGLAIFFADASHSTVIPIFPGFAQTIGASLTMLGSYGSVSALAMLILSLPLGRLSDKFGRKRLMIPGLILFIAVPLSYLLASNPLHLYPIRILLGLGMGLVFSNGFLLMTELSSLELRNLAQGVYMTSMGIGFTLGPLIGGYTAKLFGSNVSFIISAGFGLCSFLILLFVDEGKQTHNRDKPMKTITLSTILKDRQILAAGMANYLNSLMFNALTLFFPVYGVDVGFDESQIGAGFMTRGLASTVVRLPTGALSKRIKALYLMVLGLTLSALTIFSVSLSSGLILVSVLLGLQGIGYGVYLTSGNVFVASNSDEDYRGTAMAIYSIFGNLSGIINPIILGFIAEGFGSDGALKFSSIITLVAVAIVLFLAKRDSNY
jgi:MFS transporter, DHA1 family, multidrug resistance protein